MLKKTKTGDLQINDLTLKYPLQQFTQALAGKTGNVKEYNCMHMQYCLLICYPLALSCNKDRLV